MVESKADLTLPEIAVAGEFAEAAKEEMYRRMLDGMSRGWGDSFRHQYTDDAVQQRMLAASNHLNAALVNYRKGYVDVTELRKRAADVANQAFMLADAERLADEGSR